MFKVVCEICQAIHSTSLEVIETGAKDTVFFSNCTVVNRDDEGMSWEENVVVCQYCAYRYDGYRNERGTLVIDHPDTNLIFLGDGDDGPIAKEYAAYINGETGRYTAEELA